ncbi:ABC transporter permease [Nocardioides mangrovi]|uniref:ABC transporter permease n=1 Tax=Nocardioides mangrovi TaxID=2874580 RepID=A0ABS7UBT9_9ACTN|nr:ABC transporter permease [Nocardioides mangrovi]MBZ5738446.1 ABC transporter permease [Nocardioides mangrovi]
MSTTEGTVEQTVEETVEPTAASTPAYVAPPRPRAGRRILGWVTIAGPPLIVFGLIVAAWYAVNASLAENKKFLLPTLDEVISQGYLDSTIRSQILESLWQTSKVVIVGLAIAAVIGIAWAVAMSMATWVQRSTYPYAVILQTIPILAIVPLIGVWFGYEFKARVVVCVMIALFPMVSNTLFGLQSVDRPLHELFALQRARRGTVLAKLMFPAALPAIFVGLRTSAGLAVVGAIVGDFFFQRGTPGLGSLLMIYARQTLYAELFAAIFVAALLGVLVFALFGLLSKLAVGRWYEPVK